jgi:hypothetical protein
VNRPGSCAIAKRVTLAMPATVSAIDAKINSLRDDIRPAATLLDTISRATCRVAHNSSILPS